ncbi:Protein of unknown function DUF2854, partial [Dillenia turbinata]
FSLAPNSFDPSWSSSTITTTTRISNKPRRLVPKAADSTQPSTASSLDKSIVPDNDFSLSKVSFGVVGLGVGITLLSHMVLGAYFTVFRGSEWSALMLTYGFPPAIIGMAFKINFLSYEIKHYAELKPVPCLTYSDAQELRETCAAPILK